MAYGFVLRNRLFIISKALHFELVISNLDGGLLISNIHRNYLNFVTEEMKNPHKSVIMLIYHLFELLSLSLDTNASA